MVFVPYLHIVNEIGYRKRCGFVESFTKVGRSQIDIE